MREGDADQVEGEGHPIRRDLKRHAARRPTERARKPLAQGSVRRLASSFLRLPPRSHVNDIMKQRWPVSERTRMLTASDRKALRHWYSEELQPCLSRMSPNQIAQGTAVRRSYAYWIVAGTCIPPLGTTRSLPPSSALPQKFASVSAAAGS